MFEPGDPLIIDTGVKSVEFDAIYFFRVDSEGFIKRLQRIPGEGIRAISENKAYESWTIRADMDFEVFGRVLKAWKSEDY
jgi:phage repressor protein C with HTH and peptisase S24 domain